MSEVDFLSSVLTRRLVKISQLAGKPRLHFKSFHILISPLLENSLPFHCKIFYFKLLRSPFSIFCSFIQLLFYSFDKHLGRAC